MMELDVSLHQPIRTQIVAFLAGRGSATFTELKNAIGASDGNLESHLKKLISVDYLTTQRNVGINVSHNRPQTIYALSDIGHAALQQYLIELTHLLNLPLAAPTKRKQEKISTQIRKVKLAF